MTSEIKLSMRPEDMLEANERQVYFKKVRNIMAALTVVISVVLCALVALIYGVSASPLFVPMDLIALTLGIVGIIAFAMAVVLRAMQMRDTETSTNPRLISARKLYRLSVAVLAIGIVLIAALLPLNMQSFKSLPGGSWDGVIPASAKQTNITVSLKDHLSTVWANEIRIKTTATYGALSVKAYYTNDKAKWVLYTLSNASKEQTITTRYADGHQEMTLEFYKANPADNRSYSIGYELRSQVSSVYSLFVPVIGIVLAAISAPVMAYSQKSMKKLKEGAIFDSV